jgi:hypothetical protein
MASPAAKNHSLRPFIPAKTASPTDTAIHRKNAPGEYDHQNSQRGTKLSFSYGSEIAIKQTADIMKLIVPSAFDRLVVDPIAGLLRVADIENLPTPLCIFLVLLSQITKVIGGW